MTPPPAPRITDWLVSRIAEMQGVDTRNIDIRGRFAQAGIDSLGASRLVAELSELLGRPLSPTLVWEHPTIEALARHLSGATATTPLAAGDGPDPRDPKEPVAIVGMACRFPGAPDPGAFWELLAGGLDAVVEVPKDRWDAGALFDADTSAPGRLNTRWGGFLDRVDRFDAQFFGISPREAMQMDPQQRLLLELSWEALEDAGIPPAARRGSRTGVFVGALFTDYALLADRAGAEAITTHTSTGGAACIIANRVSYALGLEGPSLTVDTACSSSLVAVHLACRSLLSGETDLALAGGVNLMLVPETTMGFTKLGAMSPDGRCRAFAASANGYVRSEGAGIVALKRLSRALRDGDAIYAVVRGSAVNNDGASNGLTAPSPKAQESVLRDACADAGLAPADVHYVEAHGTGTPLGDPIEASSLGAVFGPARPADHPLLIGSAKTNVGHLEAAGIVGLAKVALAMKRDALPPSLHFDAPNPRIDFDGLRLQVVTQRRPWPAPEGAPRRAGVSSFGYGGTNSHVILESAPPSLLLPEKAPAARAGGARGPVWVFSGQGSQWPGMGRALVLGGRAFAAELDRIDRALRPHLGWSVFDEILAGAPRAVPERIDVMWPVLFAFQVALAKLLRSAGAAPAAVIGHSIGEVAAAHVAGALALEDASRVIACQARLVQRKAGAGTMLLAAVGWDEAQDLAARHGGRVTCAISASPVTTVLSGAPSAIAELSAELSARGVFVRPVNTRAAVHGPEMAFLEDELPGLLEGISPARAEVPIVSATSGEIVPGESLGAAYWARQLAVPVRFAQGTRLLLDREHDLFLEVSPHPIVKESIEESIRHRGLDGRAAVVAALVRHEDEARTLREAIGRLLGRGAPAPRASADRAFLLPVSGEVDAARSDAARRLADLVESAPGLSLDDLSFTAAVRRSHHRARAAVVARRPDELIDGLRAIAGGHDHASVRRGTAPAGDASRVVFIFPGQGSQWLGMGRELIEEEEVFRRAIEACDEAISREAGFSVLAEIRADEQRSRLSEIDVVQPVLFAIEVAIAALWRSWGVEPDCVIGHSMGEVAAAHVAGILSLEDAASVICRRSRLLRRVSGKGAMALVELTFPEAEAALAGREDRISVAVSNAPRSTVISGDPAAIEALLPALERRGVFCRRVKVDVASHSPQMDPLLDDLITTLRDLRPRSGRIPMRSTVTGELVQGPELDARYWAKNLRAPVRFSSAVQEAAKEGVALFVEVSPHPILLPAVDENLSTAKRDGAAIGSLRRDAEERRTLLEGLGALYAHGYPVSFARLHPDGGHLLPLPSYPWQRERFWLEPGTPSRASRSATEGHPFLRRHLRGTDPDSPAYWEAEVSLDRYGYLADHKVGNVVVLPGTAYLEMVLEAAEDMFGPGSIELTEVRFLQALFVPAEGARLVKVSFLPKAPVGTAADFRIHSRPASDPESAWTLHVTGQVARVAGTPAAAASPAEIMGALRESQGPRDFYDRLAALGVQYGPSFRAIRDLRHGGRDLMGEVTLSDALAREAARHRFHPVLFDACIHVMAARLTLSASAGGRGSAFVFLGAEKIRIENRPGHQAFSRITMRDDLGEQGPVITGDVQILSRSGETLAEVQGLQFRLLDYGDEAARADDATDWLYRIAWKEVSPPPKADASRAGTWLVVEPDGAFDARMLSLPGVRWVRAQPGTSFVRHSAERFTFDPESLDDFERLLGAVRADHGEGLQGVVLLGGLAGEADDTVSAPGLQAAARRACLSALHLLRALNDARWTSPPKVWLVTRGSQRVEGGDGSRGLAGAPLWGLGKSIAVEHPSFWGGLLDLAPEAEAARDAEALQWILHDHGEDHLASRSGATYAARLERHEIDAPARMTFQPDRSYLITGGLGELGLRIARWMVREGARHVILLGRRGLPPREEWRKAAPESAIGRRIAAVLDVERLGASVTVAEADVADEAALRQIVDAHDRACRPPILGVVHAAGTIEPRLLVETDAAALDAQLLPKVQGAWAIHRVFSGRALDFMVLFSSASTILRSPRLGAYAAANGFLDALAHHLRAHGLAAVSIDWGFWAEAGMGARDLGAGRGDAGSRGMRSFSPEKGLEILGHLGTGAAPQVTVMRVRWKEWFDLHPEDLRTPMIAGLGNEGGPAPGEASDKAIPGDLRSRLSASPPDDRRRMLADHVKEQLGAVLRLEVDRLDATTPFGRLGVDSLMALELRNRLESTLGVTLSVTMVWNYPTVQALAPYLIERMGLEEAPPAPEEARAASAPERSSFEDEVVDMSEDEAERLLMEKLSRWNEEKRNTA